MVKKIKCILFTAAFITTLIPNCAMADSSDNVLDTNFNNNKTSGWYLDVSGKAKGSLKVKNKELVVNIKNKGENKWDLALKHSITPLEIGATYKVQFEVYSDKNESIYAKIGDSEEPFRECWNNNWAPIEINKHKKTVSQTFTVANSSDAEEMAFQLGGELKGKVPCNIYLDDIKITKISSKNDVLKYNFNDNKIGNWKLDLQGGAKAFTYVFNGKLNVQVFSKGTDRWDVALKHKIAPLEIGAKYRVDFKLKSSKNLKVYAKIGDAADPFNEYWNNNWATINLTNLTANKSKVISQTFVPTGRSDNEEIVFHMGGDLSSYKLYDISFDDISITKISQDIPKPTITPTIEPTTTPTVSTTPTPIDSSYIINYNFSDDSLGGWVLDAINGAAASYKVENGEMKLHIDAAGELPWDVALYHKIPSLKVGSAYKIQFTIKSLNDAKVYPKIGDAGEPFREVWHPQDWSAITLPANKAIVVSEVFVNYATCLDELITFYFGGSNSNVLPNDIILDDISISEVKIAPTEVPTEIPTEIPTATPTPTPKPSADVLNYDFDNGDIGEWVLDTTNGAAATYAVENGEIKVQINAAGENLWDVSLYHKLPAFKVGKMYDIKFKMRASKDAKVYVKVGDIGEPYREMWNNIWTPFSLVAGKTYDVSSTFVPAYDSADQMIAFHIGSIFAGEVPNNIYIDDIVISEK